jgi:hypothetical protein
MLISYLVHATYGQTGKSSRHLQPSGVQIWMQQPAGASPSLASAPAFLAIVPD